MGATKFWKLKTRELAHLSLPEKAEPEAGGGGGSQPECGFRTFGSWGRGGDKRGQLLESWIQKRLDPSWRGLPVSCPP